MLFKKETGETVSDCVRRKRVDTAKTLLQYTRYTCSEIAEYLCFSTDSHFSRVFRQYAGMTPGEYRRKHYRKHWEKQVEKQEENALSSRNKIGTTSFLPRNTK